MTTPGLRPEFTMNFTFKLVYTSIVYNIEISSRENMAKLFDIAGAKFAQHINYHKYYIDYVIAGQPKSELASAVGYHNLDDPLDYEFGDKYKQISFYVRPMERSTDNFVQMERYIEDTIDEDTVELHGPPVTEEGSEIEGPGEEEILPPPPGLPQPDRIIYI
jgi:hypothetical protein